MPALRRDGVISTIYLMVVFFDIALALSQQECRFPESEKYPFFFDIGSSDPAGSVVVETVVEPADARIQIGNVRSSNPSLTDLKKHFALRRNGEHVSLLVTDDWHLPGYPSKVSASNVYVTIVCNERSYPLITVRISHANSAPPQFQGTPPYSLHLDRRTAVGSVIDTPVLAIDWDPAPEYTVLYHIVSGNEEAYFELDDWKVNGSSVDIDKLPIELDADVWSVDQLPSPARLVLRKALDHTSLQRVFLLNISASDNDSVTPLRSYATLKVIVNAKDHGFNQQMTTALSAALDSSEAALDSSEPRFQNTHYYISVLENAHPHRIANLQAYARTDDGIEYSMLPGPDSGSFAVDANTGDIHSLQAFDYEHNKAFNFQVSGCVRSNTTLCAVCNVTVTVQDENDNSPLFEQPSYAIHVPIDTPLGQEVIRVCASDKDSGSNADISYSLKRASAVFSLDAQSGSLRTHSLPRAAERVHLIVEAVDHGYPSRRQTADLFINIHDNNPSAPQFDQLRYDVMRPAPVPAGSVLVTLHANDPDPGLEGQVLYRFPANHHSDPLLSKFTINPKSGQVSTKVRLMGEEHSPVQLVVEAVDQSPTFPRKAQTIVTINLSTDLNQISFLPLPKRVFISTAKAPGSVVFKVSTTNTKSPRVFSVHGEGKHMFRMVGDELRVASKLPQGAANVTIRVEAGSASDEHVLNVVVLTDRDKYPVFPRLTYDVKVPWNATFPLLAQSFRAKVENGSVLYETFPSSSLPAGLLLNATTGDLYAWREFAESHHDKATLFSVVRARNAQYPQYYSDVGIAVQVWSANEGFSFPVKLYRLMVDENSPDGTVLGPAVTVSNREAYHRVQYELMPSSVFSIDDEGVLTTRHPIDAEQLIHNSDSIIELTVMARSGAQKANATVQIMIGDVNEYAPRFDQPLYKAQVEENVGTGHLITTVHAHDDDFSDRDRLHYTIKQDDNQWMMASIAQNGSLYTSNSSWFDYESNKSFNVTVLATDNAGLSTECIVEVTLVDVNDNEPVLKTPLIWNVTEGGEGVGSNLMITATDADSSDNGLVSFHMIQGNHNSVFHLKSLSGNKAEVRVMKALDRETTSGYVLTIEARDHGSPPLSSVGTVLVHVIDVNDCPPFFIQQHYSQNVPIELPVGFPLLTVRAEDSDATTRLTYNIEQDVSHMFTINEHTGEMSFSVPSERRTVNVHQLEVQVNDGSHTASATVTVNVYGSHHNNTNASSVAELNRAPTFVKEAFEFSAEEGVVGPIGVIKCWDADDDDVTLSIEPKSYRKQFHINPINGTLSLMKRLVYSMDRERHTFVVVATDKGLPPLTAFANVVVRLIDANHHAPHFDTPHYRAILSSAVNTPHIIALGMVVSDGDSGINAKIRYSVKGTDSECFSVDASSGSLTFSCAVDYTQKTNYTFKIVATDRDGAGLSSEADVTILVAPIVLPTSSLQNDALIGSSLLNMNESESTTQLGVSSVVESVSSGHNQQMSSSNEHIHHSLPIHKTQSVNTQSALDNKRRTETDVVTVALTSDGPTNHAPTFEHSIYKSLMPEGRYGTGAVLSMKPSLIRATDVDEGKQGLVSYRIDSQTPSIPFFINNHTGELIIFGNIDREQMSEYLFDVVATDQGTPPLRGRTRIEVKILDVNDNYPVFMHPPMVLPILDNSPTDTPITTVHAQDADSGRFGQVHYSLSYNHDAFAIDPLTGLLTTTKQLSETGQDTYNVTVVASDSGRPALKTAQQMRVEVFSSLDPSPKFKQSSYSTTVNSDATAGDNITQVVAGFGLEYSLDDSFSGLFDIADNGVLSVGRRPIKSERNRYHFLNVTATDRNGATSSTDLRVFVEGEPIVAVASTTETPSEPDECVFLSKLYNTQVKENLPGRRKLAKVTSNCEKLHRPIEYVIAQGSIEFEVDPLSGELFVNGPLDREKRSLHFVIVNVTEISNNTDGSRSTRQTNPVIEHTKSKLKRWQTLVAIHVIDENDNSPEFVKMNSEGVYVFSVDWQAPILTPIARVHAEDADGQVPLTYWISETTLSSSSHFMLNSSSGVLSLSKSLLNDRTDLYQFQVIVSDAMHNVTASVNIYRLSPETNIVLLSADIPPQDIEEWVVERRMSELTAEDVRVLVKQAYVNDDGQVDPRRTHLFVYALDKDTHVPMGRDKLRTMLEQKRNELDIELPKLAITLPAVDSTGRISIAELLLIIICIILLLIALFILFYLFTHCKRKSGSDELSNEYMVDSQTAGPRPYDVAQIDRKTARSVLSSRPLPDPYEAEWANDMQKESLQRDINLTAESIYANSHPLNLPLTSRQLNDAYGTIGPRSKNFSGDVQQVHTLVNSRPYTDATLSPPLKRNTEDGLFPTYRSQGYSS